MNNGNDAEILKMVRAKFWSNMKRGYKEIEVYNSYEACVFYNLNSDTSLQFKNESYISSKHVKNRLTDLVCAKPLDSEKGNFL